MMSSVWDIDRVRAFTSSSSLLSGELYLLEVHPELPCGPLRTYNVMRVIQRKNGCIEGFAIDDLCEVTGLLKPIVEFSNVVDLYITHANEQWLYGPHSIAQKEFSPIPARRDHKYSERLIYPYSVSANIVSDKPSVRVLARSKAFSLFKNSVGSAILEEEITLHFNAMPPYFERSLFVQDDPCMVPY